MKKNTTNIALSIICMVAVAFMLGSCGKNMNKESEQAHRKYLAVQLPNTFTWSIIDKNGKVVVETDYRTDVSSISNVYDDVYWVRSSSGRRQLFSVNQPDQPLLDEESADVADFVYCDHTLVATRKQSIRIINTKGETVATLPENVRSCQSFSKGGYAVFKNRDGKMGAIDREGKIVVEPIYTNLVPLNEGVFLTDSYQFVDAQGNLLGELDRQKYILTNLGIEDGKIVVRDANSRGSQCCVINPKGEQLFSIPAADASYYRDGYVVIKDSYGQWGVADDSGNVIISPKYPILINIGGGDFVTMANGKYGVINAKDKTIVDFGYTGFGMEKLGDNFIVGRNYVYMLVNRNGEELATFKQYGQVDHPCAYRFR